MRLSLKINLFIMAVLAAVALAITFVGLVIIDRIIIDLNETLLATRTANVAEKIEAAHQVLYESGVANVESYVRRAKEDLTAELRDFKLGKTGRLLIIEKPDKAVLHESVPAGEPVRIDCLADMSAEKEGIRECAYGGQNRLLFFKTFPEWNWLIALSITTDEMYEKRRSYLSAVSLMAGFILMCSILVATFYANRMAERVRITGDCLERAAHGDLSARITPVTSGDEIGALQTGVNAMISKIELRTLEVHSLNEALEARVLERTAELEASNRELEAFSYSVSHDLRNPLRAIDGFSHALMEDYADVLDDPGKDFLRRIRKASQLIGDVLDDLLHLIRVIRKEMNRSEVNISRMVADVVAELQQSEPDRKVTAEIEDDLHVRADPFLLRKMMENLVGNAWKFTAGTENARIEFASETVNGVRGFFVKDNGAGFDMSYADKLFTPFNRQHSPEEFDGTGVGLAIVDRVIQRHGGKIWAEAEAGRGATFHFSLSR